jgi:hypothetical protein
MALARCDFKDGKLKNDFGTWGSDGRRAFNESVDCTALLVRLGSVP